MRIYESRYARDRQRLDLAQRMVRLGARTGTVARCTALSPSQIRRLCAAEGCVTPRGMVFKSVELFWRSMVTQLDAALLAGLLRHYRAGLPLGVDRMGRFCGVLEICSMLRPDSALQLEHGIFLIKQLAASQEIELRCCECCGALMLRDRARVEQTRCPLCRERPVTPRSALLKLLESIAH